MEVQGVSPDLWIAAAPWLRNKILWHRRKSPGSSSPPNLIVFFYEEASADVSASVRSPAARADSRARHAPSNRPDRRRQLPGDHHQTRNSWKASGGLFHR